MMQRVIMFVGPDRCGKTQIAQALAKKMGAMYFKASWEHAAYQQSIGLRQGRDLDRGAVGANLDLVRHQVREIARQDDIGFWVAETKDSDGKLTRQTLEPKAFTKKDRFLNELRFADPRTFDFVKQLGEQLGTSVVFDRAYPCESAYSTVMCRETDQSALEQIDRWWSSLNTLIIVCRRSNYSGITDDLDSSINGDVLQKLDDAYMEFTTWTRCFFKELNVDDEDLDREVNEILQFIGWEK